MSRVRPTIVMFLFVVVFCLLASVWLNGQTEGLKRAQHANYMECLSIEAGHVQFNKVLDHANALAQANPLYTAAQKKSAAEFYTEAHLPILDCSGLLP